MPAEDIKPGDRLGRYLLGRELGRGAMGMVFLAEDTLLKQQLCVKVLHPALAANAEAAERFNREIVLARRVAHKGVCRLHDLHEENGVRFITMEYAEGVPLRDLLAAGLPPVPIARTLAIGRHVCEALGAAHDVGVVHRDLKPRNIMVRDDDEVTVLDFGIARALDNSSSLTLPGVALGTRHYIAPEVWSGKPATPLSDQFGVGVILFNCLTAKMPFAAKADVMLLDSMKSGPPPAPSVIRPDVPAALDKVVLRALSFRPEDRFPDIRALAHALEQVTLADVTSEESPRPVTLGDVTVVSHTPTEPVLVAPPGSGSWDPGGATAEVAALPSIRVVTQEAPLELPRAQWKPAVAVAAVIAVVAVVAVVFVSTSDPPRAGDAAHTATAHDAASPHDDATGHDAATARANDSPTVRDAATAHDDASERDDATARDTKARDATAHDDATTTHHDVATHDDVTRDASGHEATGHDEPVAPVDKPHATVRKVAASADAKIDQRRFNDEKAALDRALQQKGLVTGDDGDLDRMRAKANGDAKARHYGDAADAALEARRRADAIGVDKGFVTRKLTRFNERYDAVNVDAAARAKIDSMSSEVLRQIKAGKYDDANRALNEAFAALARARS